MVVPLRVQALEVNEDEDVCTVSGEVVMGEDAMALNMFKNTHFGYGEEYLPPASDPV
jgi:hypothetical protein